MNANVNLQKYPALLKRVDGIALWKLNSTLKKLARSKLALTEQIKDGCIVLYLPPKKERVFTCKHVKQQLLSEIEQLDSFETLRVSILENCKAIYKEQLTSYGVYRWIEIPVPASFHFKYSFAEMKEKIVENNYTITNLNTEIPLS